MDKKKEQPTKRPSLSIEKDKETSKSSAPVAKMVVEVEEEAPPMLVTAMNKIEKDTELVEKAAQKLEDDIEKEFIKEENQMSAKHLVGTEPELTGKTTIGDKNTKEVVKEFFRSNNGVAPEIDSYRKSGGKSLLVWALIVLIVAGLTGGLLMLFAGGKQTKIISMFVKPTPTPTPTPEATPTPTPSINRADLKLQVLNGGGVAGAGSKMKDFLESKGYKVAATGNADTFDHQQTEIEVKPDKEAYLSLLQEDLKDTYSVGSASATLPADSTYDAQVIVGQQ